MNQIPVSVGDVEMEIMNDEFEEESWQITL